MDIASQETEHIDRETLAALYEDTFRNIEEGTITEGRVVEIQRDRVIVDIGYKSEGIISADQFSSEELKTLAINDPLQVYIEQREDAEGNLLLSKEKADKMKVWEELEAAHQEEKEVQGRVISRIKGGMMVDIGVKAFLPGSQIDLTPVRDLDGLVEGERDRLRRGLGRRRLQLRRRRARQDHPAEEQPCQQGRRAGGTASMGKETIHS